jgi:hypothetical protein
MKHKLLTCIRTIMLFALLSICAGPAICLICKFVVLIGPVACAAIVMLTLLGWAVYHEMEDMNRRE